MPTTLTHLHFRGDCSEAFRSKPMEASAAAARKSA